MSRTTKLLISVCFLSVTACRSHNSDLGMFNKNHGIQEAYYIDCVKGSDDNQGTFKKPVKSIACLNSRLKNNPADICFAGGQIFYGTLELKGIKGNAAHPLKISSFGNGRAIINSGNSEAIRIERCRYILITDIDARGNGRKAGNLTNGISLAYSANCKVENCNTGGFQKSGIDFYNCTGSEIRKVIAADNGFCGINIMGSVKDSSMNILIKDCIAENNPGDPTILNNHSGNGILVGVSDSVTIDHCVATNNGWDMPWHGNGPVGIWTWESNNVTIQYCISYRNKTSENAKDGGGFDLDGGVTNSVIQYCLSYENQGAGYGLFQYSGASPWLKNTVRYCISINDAQTTEGAGSIFIWNGSDDVRQLAGCMIYNNLIYNDKTPLISFENSSLHKNFTCANNIFLWSDKPISGVNTGSSFVGNVWWNTAGTIKFMNYESMIAWAKVTGQETLDGNFVGIQADPKLKGPLMTGLTDPYQLDKLTGYTLEPDSPLRNKGISIKSLSDSELPGKDFFGNPVPQGPATEAGIYEMK